uniref:RNase NYN domain-containing protein n=1 Tax=Plectus sambesii TaxID=2011161 RepID=A0A914WVD2_9BILA
MALEAVENVVRVYDFFEGREEVDFDRLSKIYLDHSTSPSHQLRSRNPGELRRPILIDGLDLMKGVSGRVSDHLLIQPLLKAFFYFIARGHRTIACIPEFYRNKSDNAEALNALVQLGLIEWVPCGNIYGCSRPTMDRHLVTGAKKTSGCIVSRAQMSDLRQLWPHLAEIVEKRLLMPSWVRGEMMLPADGPQGRFGASLEATLITTTSDN